MDVQSVGAQQLAVSASPAVAKSLRSRPQNADAVAEKPKAPRIREGPGPDEEQLQQAVKKLNEEPAVQRAGIHLSIDDATQRVVAQILDEDREVVRQIPPEEFLEFAAKFRQLRGMLFDQQA